MKKFFSLQRVLALLAIVVAVWLLYPVVFGSKKPRAPEEVTVRLDAAPISQNTYLAGGHGPSNFVARQTLQTMGELDPQTLEMKPQLIVAVPKVRAVTEGPRAGQQAYDFEILPEAAWDNGTPVTGKDVLFSFKIIAHPGLAAVRPWRGYIDNVSDIEVDPANPKKFTVYNSKFYILGLETLCSVPIYPAYNYDPSNRLGNVSFADMLDTTKTATLVADPNLKAFVEEFSSPKFVNDPNAISGSGPYRMETMNEQGAVIVKKQNWWGDKLADKYPILQAYPKKIIYKVVKDDQTIVNMLKNNELDLVGGVITPTMFFELKADTALSQRYNFEAVGIVQYNRWLLNLKNPILSDVLVRRALRHIVDYDYMINQVQRGLAERITSPMPPNRPYYAKNLPMPDFNIAKAKELLAQAGWADTDGDGIVDKMINGEKKQLSFSVMASLAIKTNELATNSMKETARQAGIDLQIVAVDLSKMSTDTRSGNYDSALMGVAMYPGMIEFYQRYHSKSLAPAGDNRGGYVNEKADRLIEAIRDEPDEAKRNAMYLEIQQLFYDDVVEIPMYAPYQRVIIAKKFESGVASANRPGYYEHFARMKPE